MFAYPNFFFDTTIKLYKKKGYKMQQIRNDNLKNALFIIDGSSLLYRSYYGIRPLHTTTGTPTQATYGFCRAIKRLIDDFDPKYLLIAWDSKGKTFRSEIFKEYKATREAPPSDLFIQKEQILKIVDLVDIAQVSKTGYEADDLIYSLVQDHKDRNVVIVGPDKDLHQLISDRVIILDPMKKEIIDEKVFKNKRGFGPEKLSFYHSLVGDASDNIPGVKGIGKVGATEIVKKFDSLDNVYENLDKVKKERTRNALEKHKDDAYLSLKLFSLKHTTTPVTLKKIQFDKTKWSNANDFFLELEFKSLVTRTPDSEAQTTFLETQKATKQTKKSQWKCVIVKDEQALNDLIKLIKEKKLFALDTETTGLDPLQDKLVGLSIACNTKQAFYIPFSHTDNNQLDRNETLKSLQPIFTSKTIKKVLHHTKFDELVLAQYDIKINNVIFDTILAANLLRKGWDKIGLKKLSVLYLNEKMDDFSDVMGKKYKTFDQVPIVQAATYAAHDALQTFKLTKVLTARLNKEKTLKKIFDTVEMPLYKVLLDMELAGMNLDVESLKDLEQKVNRKLTTIEKKIFGAHKKINLNSPKQVEKLLFDELKLPVIKKSMKGKRSTDQEVLSKLSEQHPIPGLILKYREFYKLKSTYIEALPKSVNPKTGRIHTTFSQTMVSTGRLSSSGPNLQNIPAGGEFGLKIREAFVAPRGKSFLSADYSQIELRVLAHMTGDKNLTASFMDSEDIHARTASELFDVPVGKVTHEQRQIGKRINFSIVYGSTPYGLSKDLDIKQSEAKEYIDKYFERYPKVAEWMEETVMAATKAGFTQTLMGRRRYIPGLREKNKTLYMAARRIAINSPVQGTSAEIMKVAMINLHNKLNQGNLQSKLVLQIHDELLLECPNEELKTVEKIVKKEMESAVKWAIPLIVSIRTGKNWAKITK
jgi:DNA polymerase-1